MNRLLLRRWRRNQERSKPHIYVPSHLFAGKFVLCLLTGMMVFADGGWKQARPGYTFQFPRDHASHPEYKLEWWYYTGNLATSAGQRFGYQLTFFRVGVDPKPTNPSVWAVRDLYMAHFAITDVSQGRYRFAERMNRSGVGWAGASTAEYHVWNQDWEAKLSDSTHQLRAAEGEMTLSLELAEEKAPVVHGERGISQKGSQTGNASHYYSLTRMPTHGELRFGGKRHAVEGLSWMDHEFGTSFLEAEQIGWDWFSIQLEDGVDLMLFQLRRVDGSRDPRSGGTWVEVDRRVQTLRVGDFTLKPGEVWRSPESGGAYPVTWEVEIPKQNLILNVRSILPDQELRTERSTGVNYWEGAVEVGGTREGRPIRGRGYLEMTGYSGRPISDKFR